MFEQIYIYTRVCCVTDMHHVSCDISIFKLHSKWITTWAGCTHYLLLATVFYYIHEAHSCVHLMSLPPLPVSSQPNSLAGVLPVFSGPLIMSAKCMEAPLPGQLCFLLHLRRHLLNPRRRQGPICNFRALSFPCLCDVRHLSYPLTATGSCSICRSTVLRPSLSFWVCLFHSTPWQPSHASQMLLIPPPGRLSNKVWNAAQ